MSDEKRQTRLLPFRLRRAGGVRRDPRQEFDRHARGEFGGAEDFSADAELTALLRSWDAPTPTAEARAQLLADFRVSVRRTSVWRRALAAELRVPLPLAACAVFALVLSLFALGTRAWTRNAQSESRTEAPAVVKIVEVPVVQERVVTRTVYVEKKERDAARGVSARAQSREEVGTEAGGNRQTERTADQGTPVAGYFTRVDMKDFQPADELKIRLVKKGRADEK